MPRQDPLPLPRAKAEALTRADFFESPANATALAAIEGWQGWPEGKLVLAGPEGAGKSHLTRIWADLAQAALIAPDDLARADLPALAAKGAVALDDAEGVAGDPGAERALFHLHNLITQRRGFLLLAAREPAPRWPVRLPDLASRLAAIPLARLEPPDEALLSMVLVKLFADRQLAVAPPTVAYLARHLPRSLAAARRAVAQLDSRALETRRGITRALAIEVLDSLRASGP